MDDNRLVFGYTMSRCLFRENTFTSDTDVKLGIVEVVRILENNCNCRLNTRLSSKAGTAKLSRHDDPGSYRYYLHLLVSFSYRQLHSSETLFQSYVPLEFSYWRSLGRCDRLPDSPWSTAPCSPSSTVLAIDWFRFARKLSGCCLLCIFGASRLHPSRSCVFRYWLYPFLSTYLRRFADHAQRLTFPCTYRP